MASNNRNLANLLSPGSSQIPASKLPIAGTEEYSGVDSLGVGSVIGEQAYVSGNNQLYIWNGTGWYSIAIVNTSPTWTSGYQPNASYNLDGDSPQSPTVITLRATDPEGLPITYSHVIGGSMDSIATISQDSSVFTITPKTQAQVGDGTHTGSITFRATDGINILPQVSSFTLEFVSTVTNSRYTVSLINAVSTGNNNNNITDASNSNHTITVNGDATAGTFSPYRHGGYSAHFVDGTDDYIKSEVTSTLNLANNTNWTVEGWYNFTDAPGTNGRYLFSNDNGTFSWSNINYMCYFNTSSTLKFEWGGGQNITMNFTPEVGRWYHLAWSCDGTTIRAFVDGNVLATNTGSTQFYTYSSAFIQIGRPPAGYGSSKEMKGHVSDFRIVVGTCVYSANFAVPSQRLTAIPNTKLLTCNSVLTFADNSSQSLSLTPYGDMESSPFAPYDNLEYDPTVHGGSVYFDGTGDNIETQTNQTIPTGNWTISYWVNWNRIQSNNSCWGQGLLGDTGRMNMYIANDRHAVAFGGGSYTLAATNATVANLWYFIQISFDAASQRLDWWENGIKQTSGTSSNTGAASPSATVLSLGGSLWYTATPLMEGYMADFLVVPSHTASAMDVPTGQRSTPSNAVVHIKGTDASFIDESQISSFVDMAVGNDNNGQNVEPSGSTTQVKFAGTKSMHFDQDVAIIKPTDINDYILGTGDFTIEKWIYFTSFNSGDNVLYDFRPSGVNGAYLNMYENAGTIKVYVGSANANTIVAGSAVSLNTWHHIALCRSGTSKKLFIDGNQSGSTYTDNVSYTCGDRGIVLGSIGYNNSYSAYGINAYIQDFRITKGLARYTSNFTPPTEPLKG